MHFQSFPYIFLLNIPYHSMAMGPMIFQWFSKVLASCCACSLWFLFSAKNMDPICQCISFLKLSVHDSIPHSIFSKQHGTWNPILAAIAQQHNSAHFNGRRVSLASNLVPPVETSGHVRPTIWTRPTVPQDIHYMVSRLNRNDYFEIFECYDVNWKIGKIGPKIHDKGRYLQYRNVKNDPQIHRSMTGKITVA